MNRHAKPPVRHTFGGAAAETGDVLTLSQAAILLGVSERELWALARSGNVPNQRVGCQHRFLKSVLVEWASDVASAPTQE